MVEGAPVLTRSAILFAESWRATDNMFVPFTRDSGGIDVILVSVSISNEVFADDRTTGKIAVIRD